jgi:Heat induced stress protein YflT domain
MSQIWTGCPSAHASWAEAWDPWPVPSCPRRPVHCRVTAPSLGSALLAGGPWLGDVPRACARGMSFAKTPKNGVTERHGTASIAVEERRAVVPPQTREELRNSHHDTRREPMAEHNAVVGIYTTHTEAEAAVKELQRSGFDMQQLSIVGKRHYRF